MTHLTGCASAPMLQSARSTRLENSLADARTNEAPASPDGSIRQVSHMRGQSADFDGEPQIERGRPNVVIDGVGWVMGAPEKLYMWNRKVNNHSISDETERELQEFLQDRNLSDVKVRLNQYDPIGEWQRLVANKEVGAGWRYTFGGLRTLGYTILPGRLFGSDDYNPYTNSIYVYSDVPELAMAEAARANDVRGRTNPGSYAFVQSLPIIRMHGETIATDDVLAYMEDSRSLTEQQEAVQVLYPRYGLRAGQSVAGVFPAAGSIALIGGAVAGHATGRIRVNEMEANHQLELAQAAKQRQKRLREQAEDQTSVASFEQQVTVPSRERGERTASWEQIGLDDTSESKIDRTGFLLPD